MQDKLSTFPSVPNAHLLMRWHCTRNCRSFNKQHAPWGGDIFTAQLSWNDWTFLGILNFESLKLKSLLSHERHTKWRRPSWRTIETPRKFSVKQSSSAFLASSLSPALTIRFCCLPYSGSHVTSLHQGLSSSEWGAPSKEPGNEVEHIMYII